MFFELITDDGQAEGDDFDGLPEESHLEMKLEDFKVTHFLCLVFLYPNKNFNLSMHHWAEVLILCD